MSIALLSTFWQAARAEERPALGAAVLDQLARLQFCRQRVQGYAVLLQMVMPAVAAAQEVRFLPYTSVKHVSQTLRTLQYPLFVMPDWSKLYMHATHCFQA